jgi:hypothetical protein
MPLTNLIAIAVPEGGKPFGDIKPVFAPRESRICRPQGGLTR